MPHLYVTLGNVITKWWYINKYDSHLFDCYLAENKIKGAAKPWINNIFREDVQSKKEISRLIQNVADRSI